MQVLVLDNSTLGDQLPASWGSPGVLSNLSTLSLQNTGLTGSLPSSWGSAGAYPQLQYILLFNNSISGTLPEDWTSAGGLARLQWLDLSHNRLSGGVPPSWGSVDSFPSLVYFDVSNTFVNDSPPMFNNVQLRLLDLDTAAFSGSLEDVWLSSAPLVAVSMANNSITGKLSNDASVLDSLLVLDLNGNHLHGTVPLSWMQQGQLISHLLLMNLGSTWGKSTSENSWRQQVCLQPILYDPDVTGQQLLRAEELLTNLLGLDALTPLATSSALTLTKFLSYSDQNQLLSVKTICANRDTISLLLVVWLVFGALVVCIIVLYACLQCWHGCSISESRNGNHDQPSLGLQVCKKVWYTGQVGFDASRGLIGLGFYYFDLVSSIIVLIQVWGTWPGIVLITVFLCHFALTGAVVLFWSLSHHLTLNRTVSLRQGRVLQVKLVAVLLSPFMIIIVLVLDSLALFKAIGTMLQLSAKLHNLWVSFTQTKAVANLVTCLHCHQRFGLGWMDLEHYDSMHNAIAAIFQTIPTVVLNSVIFSLGNKPSNGIFISDGLFVRAVIGSFAALLKQLIVVLWQAHCIGEKARRYVAEMLCGEHLPNEEKNPEAVDNPVLTHLR